MKITKKEGNRNVCGALLCMVGICIARLLRSCHHEAYVDSLYGFVDAIEHGLYSSFIGSVEQTHLLHDGNLHVHCPSNK